MSKTKLKQIVSQLTKEQQQSLAEIVSRRKTQQLEPSDIAIIGLSGRYPQADNHYDFWNKVQQRTNFIQEVPVSRWDHSDYYDPQVNKSFVPHKTRCKFGAFLNAYDQFDASFFDLHPGEVSGMDPQERLALETSWSCIEDAGYVPSMLDKEVGIFSGLTYGEYQKIIPITTHFCMLNNRIAYFFNFQGPTVTTDAGCSSSLTAIHLACQSLIRKECQTAIVIGANVILHPDHYTSLSSSLSPTTQPVSNPFGTDDGWIPAEGVVSILLKPLQQALQSQDHIYAVIKSSHISQEGKTSWFSAFNPKRQAALIHDNFKKSGIHPETIGYVEAAANGSSLGDAIELEGLITAFNRFTDKKQFCPIGSVKSNVGHGEAVSTLLQLTKVLLQFKSKTIIPLINLKEKNPNLRIENSPFYLRTSTQKWEPPTLKLNGTQFTIPRRATISSFGGGGNIGHLILEEYVPENIKTQTPGSYFIPISSKTTDQLRKTIENYIGFFKEYQTFDSEWEANYKLLNIMFTLCVGRVPFQERVVFIVKNLETLMEKFHQYLNGENDPGIISKAKAGTIYTTTENNRELVQSYIKNHSWHDLAELWVRGIDISWERFFNSYHVQRIPLPSYCFQRQFFPIPKPIHPNKSVTDNSNKKTPAKIGNHPDHTINKSYPAKVTTAAPGQVRILKEPSFFDIETDTRMIKIFREIFAKAMNIPASQIDLSTPLDRYGFDSAMVVTIANELEPYFSTVPKTLFFECQTIRDVINYFIKEYPDETREIIQKKENKKAKEDSIPGEVGVNQGYQIKNIDESTSSQSSRCKDIAIIGLAGRYPQAKNMNEFWQNLKEGKDSILEIPPDRWKWQDYFHPDRQEAFNLGKSYSKWGGFIDDIDKFDPLFFNISPRDAEIMDPQERLFLEVAWEVLEDAGYGITSLKSNKTNQQNIKVGVFVGATWEEYQFFSGISNNSKEVFSTNTSNISNRVSYFCDFRGSSLTVNTACSSSLTAIHLACASLIQGTDTMAIAGGVNLSIHPKKYLFLSNTQFVSGKGRCESFGRGGDGYVPGEGVGCVLLKPLQQAIADQDHIYGIIKGSAINHGGKTNGYTVPNPNAQASVIGQVFKEVGISPRTISYIEAHGTGTSLGDPVEIAGLTKTFREYTKDKQFCAIGSVKSNIGHAEAAAGIAGLTKVLLQLKHRQLVPSLHSQTLNPNINFSNIPFVVQQELAEWKPPRVKINGVTREYPRRAGISSFGAGGANAHVVIEEYIPDNSDPVLQVASGQKTVDGRPMPECRGGSPCPPPRGTESHVIILSAKNTGRLQEQAQRLLAAISGSAQSDPDMNLADMAYTLQVGREAMEERLAVMVGSLKELREKLEGFLDGQDGIENLYRGQVKRNKETLAVFAADEELQEAIDKWIQRRKYAKLLDLWVKGLIVDWTKLYGNTKPHKPRRISLPTYPFARERYWIPGTGNDSLVSSESAKKTVQLKNPLDELMHLPLWEAQPLLNPVKQDKPRTVLIVYSQSSHKFAETIIDYYRQNKTTKKVIQVQLSNQTEQVSEEEWRCDINDPKGFETCLPGYGSIDCLYFISGCQGEKQPIDFDALANSQQDHEIQLLRLIKFLKQNDTINNRIDCTIITRDNYRITDIRINPYGGGITGLAYSIAQGDHRFSVKNIDISSEDIETPGKRDALLRLILNEEPSDRGEVIKFKNGSRYKQVFLQLDWNRFKKESGLPGLSGLKTGGVYVILGGSGTVGSVITRYLMQEYHARVIWIGRKPKTDNIIQKKIESLRIWGEPPLYIQADATSLSQMEQAVTKIKRQFSTVNGAIFSGLVFNFENSINKTNENEFLEILNVKTIGSVNFYHVFQDQPLDFMCYFSSAQAFSFSGAANLSAYATGITFSDTFIRFIRGTSQFPVGIINWGFWKSSMEGTVLSKSSGFLEDREGFDCFEHFTRLLQGGALNQVACLRASGPVRELMNYKEEEIISICEKRSDSMIRSLMKDNKVNEHKMEILIKSSDPEEFNEWVSKLLFVQMRQLGLFRQRGVPEEVSTLRKKAGVIDKYDRWMRECLGILEAKGCVQCEAGQVKALEKAELEDEENVWKEWNLIKESYLDAPGWEAQVKLVDVCLQKLPEILRGNLPATDILFPNSSMEMVEGIYKNNALSDYFNTVVADVTAAYVRQRLKANSQTKVRIIEIGAGTGGTSAMVFAKLKPYVDHIEYCYTDISKSFLMFAEEQYGPVHPYLKYKLWNIEKSLTDQGIEVGGYDMAIAANVLHATKNIRQTIRNTKAALKTNGILLLNEGTQKTIFATLTFGLLDGWWLYEDEPLRIPGSPLLYPGTWQEVLEEEGFRQIHFPAESAHTPGQQIIAAESDGVVRQKVENNLIQEEGKDEINQDLSPSTSRQSIKEVTIPTAGVSAESIEEYVKHMIINHLAKSLKISRESIAGNVAFSDYGLDSIIGVNFVKQLSDRLGVTMNSSILFDFTTIDRLTGYIVKTYKEQIQKHTTLSSDNISHQKIVKVKSMDGLFKSDSILKEDNYNSVPQKTDEEAKVLLSDHFTLTGENTDRSKSAEIAIIGMTGQFPDAKDVDTFWQNLIRGHDSIHQLPSQYLYQSQYFSSEKQSGEMYYNWGGILEDRDCFDPLFFNISPREAESMNPHQRLILQESWKAIEDAGYNPKGFGDSQVGMFIGAEPTGYFHKSFTGASDAIIASRLSYFLNLNGPAMVVNTGCSSSAVAIHLACESLRNGESSLAIAGGVFANMDKMTLVTLTQLGMLSPSGRCCTFDESGDGAVMSEGVGVVVLKRLRDAISAGDHIYGVIKGSGVNQDGASNGITAPNGVAQEQLITSVYKRYCINPEEITYIETHGTGTKLGDPVEANALVRAFKQFTNKEQYCAVGSAKSHIGHTGAAAGVIGLIRILLSLRHHKTPGLIHFKKLNPLIEFKDSAFYVNTKLLEWRSKSGKPLMAALNSFGHSGTNAHFVVREYIPPDEMSGQTPIPLNVNEITPVIIPLSAKNKDRLRDYVGKLLGFLKNSISHDIEWSNNKKVPGELPDALESYDPVLQKDRPVSQETKGTSSGLQGPRINLASLAYTLQTGREAMEERMVFLVKDIPGLITKLAAFAESKEEIDNCWRGQVKPGRNKVGLFDTNEELNEAVGKWIVKGKLRKIAELWAQGFAINWELLYRENKPKPQRIGLPTYTFARERYWRPEIDANSASSGTVVTSALTASIHPLLHQNTSDLSQQRFSSTFTGQEFFLADHVMKGQRVLPGVAYLEMARAAVAQAAARPIGEGEGQTGIRLKNVVWVQPIAVGEQPVRVHIGLFPGDNGEIVYEIYSKSEATEEELVVYSQGSAVLSPAAKAPTLDLKALQSECSQTSLGSSQCYDAFKTMGIDYGPAHQGIKKVYVGPGGGQVLAELSLPSSVSDTRDQFILHPSLMDSALQASIGLIMGQGDSMPSGSTAPLKLALPFALQELEILGNCTSTMWALVRYSDDSAAGDKVQKLDIDLCDHQGSICVRIKEFSSRVLEGEVQTSGEPLVGTIMLTPVWDPIPAAKGQTFPSPTDQVVIVGGTNDKNNRSAIQQLYPNVHELEIQLGDSIKIIAKKLEAHGSIDHILWIAPYHPLESLAGDVLIEEQDQGVLHCFRMIKALLGLGYGTRDLGWSVITTQAQAIGENHAVNPTHASLHGLIGSLAKEYPNWKVRLIDLEADCDWPLAHMFTLPTDPQGNARVYRSRQWYRQQLIPLHCSTVDQELYRSGGVYVVIGGAGGIGEAWSEYMIRTYQARIIWIGRREKDTTIQAKIDSLASLGPAPLYIAADATDREALYQAYEEIKQKYSQINGVIHSALIMLGGRLANMDIERFQAVLSAKVDVCVRMAQVFQKEPLDFVLFFSSINSFLKAPRQTNYASGCTFKDAFARQLSQEWPCAVKVMNWGYWGSVGLAAASKGIQKRMELEGIGFIEPQEAMEALETLMAGPMDQIAFMKTTKPSGMEGMNPNLEELMTIYPQNLPAMIKNIQDHIPIQDSPVQRMKSEKGLQMKEMDELVGRLLWGQLQSIGLFTEKKSVIADLKTKTGLPGLYNRWLEETITFLARGNYLQYDGESCTVMDSTPMDIDAVWKEWDQQKGQWLEEPTLKALVVLVEATLRALPQILTGKQLATDVLFPNSSMELVEEIYKNNPIADYFNEILAETAAAYIRERLKKDPSAGMRILEIGAGTGGTSTMVFKKFKPYRDQIQEYCYTDISKAFLMHAEKEYGPGNPCLTYRIFNVEAPIAGQSIDAGGYDIVIAANVLHATKNIRQTLRNTKAALKKNGVLLLNEMSANALFTHLTFGLLEGWWLYEDQELRIPGCPGLSPGTWQEVLVSEGFQSVVFPAQEAHDLGQQIIAAESDGVVRQKQQLKPAVTPMKQKVKTKTSKSSVARSTPQPPTAQDQHLTLQETKTIQKGAEATNRMAEDYVKETIIEKLSASLNVDIDVIDANESFADYGLDSILGVEFIQAINQTLRIELKTISLFEYNSVNQLTTFILSQHTDAVTTTLKQKVKQIEMKHDLTPDTKEKHPVYSYSNRFIQRRVPGPGIKKKEESIGTGDSIQKGPIAIIGMSGRFAKSKTVKDLWEHLAKGTDLVEEVSRWDLSRYYADSSDEEKNYCHHGSFLDDIDRFDPLFFNISGVEATYMDPQQRFFLEECWKALEDAGYAGTAVQGRLCGVYVGFNGGDYQRLIGDNPPAQALWGNIYSVLPARISYYLNLQGPAVTIDTACSSSLTAIHLACQGLWARETELALAGGVFIQCTPGFFISGNRGRMLSATGHCYTFDERADGFVPGEGVGVVVLKQLKEAIADGDHIYGVIRGSGINQDGTTNGITAPSANSQERLERYVYDTFNIHPEQISMVEAHGTGTILGDPIEYDALTRAFGKYTDKKEYCAIGSIKTNIGHATAAAGIAGFIKILLSLQHKQIPPSLHYRKGNPNIQFEGSPFYVNTSLKDWESEPNSTRCAVISAFGLSGTNAHLAIGEAPKLERQHPEKPGYLIVLSARTLKQLHQQVEQIIEYCKQESRVDCGNMSYTLLLGRKHLTHRLACVVRTREELVNLFKKWLEKGKVLQIYVSEVHEKDHREQPSLKRYGNQCIRDCQNVNKTSEYPEHLAAIADLYIQGYELEFEQLFSNGQYSRISLPTYPFARERYWIAKNREQGTGDRELKIGGSVRIIHPLLHQNTSDFSKQRFSSTFTGQEFFLADHVVKGKRILPGVAYLEMARAAVGQAAGVLEEDRIGVRLKNVVWVQPIVVGDQPVQVQIGLFPKDNGQITYEIYSQPKVIDEGSVLHSQGSVLLGSAAEAPTLDLKALQTECSQTSLDPGQCYEAFKAMGIDYGPGHQGIEEVYVGHSQVLAKLSLPSSVSNTRDQFILHPSLMDSALQASIGLMMGAGDMVPSTSPASLKPALPFALQELEIFGNCTSTMWVLVRYSDDSAAGDKVQKFDIDLCDETGTICVRMKGLSSRVLEGNIQSNNVPKTVPSETSIEPLVGTGGTGGISGTIMLIPVWDTVPIEKGQTFPSPGAQVVIVGGTNDKDNRSAIHQHYPKAHVLEIQPGDTIDTIAKKLEAHGFIDHILWIAPHNIMESLAGDALIEEQNQGVLQCFRMIKALLGLGYGTRDLGWSVLTIQTQPIRENDGVNPTHASLYGLIGSMAKEYSNWKIRLIDLEANCDWPLADIFTLPTDPQGNARVYRGQQWHRQQLIPFHCPPPPADKKLYRSGGVYVVIGGAGGIGQAWSEYMIRTYQARIIWIGRRQKGAAIQAKLDRLAALGPAPLYIAADAADKQALKQAYEEIKQQYSQINGVIHSAIVLLDQSLAKMEEERFQAGLAAKVDVCARMAQVFQKEPLDFVLFFSSMISFTKAAGQSNYASGCTFKDAFAHQLSQEWPCAVKVMNWGYWGSIGVVASKTYRDRMAQAGAGSIEPPEAMEALEKLLAGPITQTALMKSTKPLLVD